MFEPAPRFYLATPPLEDLESFTPLLREALAAFEPACLLLRLGDTGSKPLARAIRSLAAPAQERGVAVLVEGAPALAIESGADGAQVRGSGPQLREAVKLLSPKHIVGADRLRERHDAMVAGEAGADYVLFGDLDEPLSDVVKKVSWWAETFKTPCVALAHSIADLEALAETGAEFLMLGDFLWRDPRGLGAVLADARPWLTEGA